MIAKSGDEKFFVNNDYEPLVTIITVVYNGDKYLRKAIQSIRDQTYKNLEYIIIDGDSKDKTVNIIKDNKDIVSFWISEPDEGLYDAMNKGIKLASGSIIGLLNCDDWYNNNSIELVVNFFNKHRTCEVIHGQLDVYDKNGFFLYRSKNKKYPLYKFFRTPFKHPTCFYKKTAYEKIGLFNTKYKLIADYDLMLRTINSKTKVKYLKKPLTNFLSVGLTSGNKDVSGLKDMEIIFSNYIKSKVLIRLILSLRVMKKRISIPKFKKLK